MTTLTAETIEEYKARLGQKLLDSISGWEYYTDGTSKIIVDTTAFYDYKVVSGKFPTPAGHAGVLISELTN